MREMVEACRNADERYNLFSGLLYATQDGPGGEVRRSE